MQLIRPRITDYHGISKCQADLDFAIQFFDEDIPLYVDPFLLWKSPSQQDQALHTAITNSFNYLNYLLKKKRETDAVNILIGISECSEVGLGVAKTRKGKKIGEKQAQQVLSLFRDIPEYSQFGFTHFEAVQLYISGISKDRVSDIACNYIKSFLIDYTIEQCEIHGIPIESVILDGIYNYKEHRLDINQKAYLPVNPQTKSPILFTPKRWLRYTPWINFDDYFRSYCPKDEIFNPEELEESRVKVLNYNRENYGVVEEYIKYKDKTSRDCKNDPLFSQIPVLSASRKLSEILKLNTGKEDGADWRYENLSSELLASLLYPHLDFAQTQSRTDSGRHIRDLIFYNNRDLDFLNDIFTDYGNRQLIIEMKNVRSIEREHINQLNRYLHDAIGRFGVFLTRNPLSKPMFENTVDLWSSQRKCIIALTDDDLKLMVEVYESKQRAPIEVLKKKYVQFKRACPS
ncbi:hypothetical protein [Nitrosovibrio tenuis]|uniref:Uncharacterized protein n=1 Tax=Nitrosovibrio tenuis TaxID=1233 RepID=A0A1H7KQ26_9PROT|nr:hypothetical protein [Nitrosovibrio tenuis]SEK88879.1 hypothetical protein SAMN05216387_103303 [Nitrosovibrio tenuis]